MLAPSDEYCSKRELEAYERYLLLQRLWTRYAGAAARSDERRYAFQAVRHTDCPKEKKDHLYRRYCQSEARKEMFFREYASYARQQEGGR